MAKIRRIGILGGTFNPIHLGHLILAEQAKEILHLQKVIFVPTNIPPHKKEKQIAPAHQRYHMGTLAVKSNHSFDISDLEIKRGGISYTVETLKEFKSLFRYADFYFIVGSDFFKEFSTWKDKEEINKICKFVVAQRPGFPSIKPYSGKKGGSLGKLNLPKKIRIININTLDISSTQIRKRIIAKRSIRYLVPEEVRKYILKKKLYF